MHFTQCFYHILVLCIYIGSCQLLDDNAELGVKVVGAGDEIVGAARQGERRAVDALLFRVVVVADDEDDVVDTEGIRSTT